MCEGDCSGEAITSRKANPCTSRERKLKYHQNTGQAQNQLTCNDNWKNKKEQSTVESLDSKA